MFKMSKKAQNKFTNIPYSQTAAASSSIKAAGEFRDPSTQQWRLGPKIIKGGLFKNIKSIPFDPKVDVPHGVCFNCWEYGHSRQKCKEPDRLDHCRNCGRIGVRVKTCPRCSEAYWNYWQEHAPSSDKVQNIKLELAKVRKAQGWSKADNKVICLHFSDVEKIPFDPEVDIPYKICSNCWKSLHPGLCDAPRVHDHCFNCGRIVVHMINCPRCSKAYPRYCERKKKAGISDCAPASTVPRISAGEGVKKFVQPETTKADPKPSAFRTISPNSAWTKSFSAVLKDKDEGYVSQNGSITNGETSNKIDNSSTFKFTYDYVNDFKGLMEAIKHLSIANQDAIVLQFLSDRRKFIEQITCQQESV